MKLISPSREIRTPRRREVILRRCSHGARRVWSTFGAVEAGRPDNELNTGSTSTISKTLTSFLGLQFLYGFPHQLQDKPAKHVSPSWPPRRRRRQSRATQTSVIVILSASFRTPSDSICLAFVRRINLLLLAVVLEGWL
ncbi:hypothetical protein GALMADRAFT_1084269 [Galerina marginata CBS 339.88]|uniref:Uncharacterized protein n=1 Tax=Galerina marginata (strain CBS 339.88) TaxID=685588 RepID=A0A067SI15_GALM3|nr:hypothetical protein GALMADRAFT_1084269 [Galerina marginata CBS 339.88]